MTRSRISGKVRMGATEIGSPSGKMSIRVMHMSRGLPLISALHEPHLPALQFQRQARSSAWVAWIRWMTSRTTRPSPPSTLYSLKSPASGLPRNTRIVKVGHHFFSWRRALSSGGIWGSGSRRSSIRSPFARAAPG